MACLFILLTMSFKEQKLFDLTKSNLYFFFYGSHSMSVRKILCLTHTYHKDFLLCFLPQVLFLGLGFMFSFVVHFELILFNVVPSYGFIKAFFFNS